MGKTGLLCTCAVLVVGCAPLDGLSEAEKAALVEQGGGGDKGGDKTPPSDPDSKDGDPLPGPGPSTPGPSGGSSLPPGMLASFDFELPAQQTTPDFVFSGASPLGGKVSAYVNGATFGTKRVAMTMNLPERNELWVSLRFRVDMPAPVSGDPSFMRALDATGKELMRLQLGSNPGLKVFRAGKGDFIQTNPGLTPKASYRVLLHLRTGISNSISASLAQGDGTPALFIDNDPLTVETIRTIELGNVAWNNPQSITMTFDDVKVSEKPIN